MCVCVCGCEIRARARPFQCTVAFVIPRQFVIRARRGSRPDPRQMAAGISSHCVSAYMYVYASYFFHACMCIYSRTIAAARGSEFARPCSCFPFISARGCRLLYFFFFFSSPLHAGVYLCRRYKDTRRLTVRARR